MKLHMPDASLLTTEDILKRVWGFDTLRPLQKEVIDASIRGRDALIVMPTGGGKSLCFQIPPLVDGGLTLVVSPLISLMTDQVHGLKLVGYPCDALHSGLDSASIEAANERIASGVTKLLYCSPERLMTASMQSLLRAANRGAGVARIAIDEAHCISAWGHDFRPEYRDLSRLRALFPEAPIHALTATATPRVRDDIIGQLRLREPDVFIGNFDRPNLNYRVLPKQDLIRQSVEVLQRYPHDGAIVYCISRKDTEEMARALTALGVPAAAYHAGMDSGARHKISEDFARERIRVVVATVAFGMGIDRSNVRCVIHASLPKSIEGYHQETGRAGRDGLPSECVMFYSAGDVTRWARVMTEGSPEQVAHQRHLLDEMSGFATGVTCRHARLVEYFGQSYEGPRPCGACDVCESAPEEVPDSTRTAHKILATAREICQADFGFGVNHLVGILRGADTKPIRTHQHQLLKGYGCFKEFHASRVGAWIQQLIDHGLLGRSGGKFPTLTFTELGRSALQNRQEITLYDSHSVALTAPSIDPDDPLFEVLRSMRRNLAEEREVPAFVIFSDATLKALAAMRPTEIASLPLVPGIGEHKTEQFGERITSVIREYCEANELATNLAAPKSAPKKKESGRLTATAIAARPLFEKGVDLETVATELGRARSTMAGYLYEWACETNPKSIAPWVSDETLAVLAEVRKTLGNGPLKPIFEHLNQTIPYDQIRLGLWFLDQQDS